MKSNKLSLIKSIALPLIVGGIAGFLTRNSMEDFAMLNQPPLSPPGWLFPVVWTILYTLMGISAHLIRTSDANDGQKDNALKIYYLQLFVNFLWPLFFFVGEWYFFSLLWLILLWLLIAIMITRFGAISKPAAYLNIPYFIWVTFATYLNAGIWILNR